MALKQYFAAFVQAEGEGIWCNDGEYFAEYFSNLELSGSATATICEQDTPDFHWHGGGMRGTPEVLGAPGSILLFSVR